MIKINRVRWFFFILSQASCHKCGELHGDSEFFICLTLVMKLKTSFSILYQAQNLHSLSFYLQIEIKFLEYVFRCLRYILLCTSSNISQLLREFLCFSAKFYTVLYILNMKFRFFVNGFDTGYLKVICILHFIFVVSSFHYNYFT